MNHKKLSVIVISVAIAAIIGIAAMAGTANATTGAPQITRDLTVGSIGEDVRSLQQFLNSKGYMVAATGPGSSGNETTRFGLATKSALAKFQAANGLPATGYLGPQTRSLLSGIGTTTDNSSTLALIEALKKQIAALQAELNAQTSNSGDGPYITSIAVSDGGDEDYIDIGDVIKITFNEEIDPESVNDDLEAGDYVTGIGYSEVGGVSVASSGKVTIKGIATFDAGSVETSRNFTSKVALNSTGKILTVTLTSGSDVEIDDEDFSDATQTGGTVENEDGEEMESDSDIDDPTGTFGGESDNGDDDDDDNGDGPYITAISVSDGGDEDYIDIGDAIKITFNEEIDPESVNDDLEAGDYVNNISYSETGGVSVSSAGKITIKNIATFDMGSVENSANFTTKLALSSSGKILTVTITSGGDTEIDSENFSDATQTGGTVENEDGEEMESDSDIDDPTGTFGGDDNGGSGDGPGISSIVVTNSGEDGFIDVGDTIKVTFNEAVDPKSINSSLGEGGTVSSVPYSQTGGVAVSSSGEVTIKNIATFDAGSVENSGTFTVKLALGSTGKVLTITLTSGSDTDIEIDDEDFSDATQIGGTIENEDGDEMESDSSISDPTGTFGGEDSNDSDDTESPYIYSMSVTNGGDTDNIDIGDAIKITFSEEIDPESINDDLEVGDYVTGIGYSEVGGVAVASSGKVTIKGIATFDAGSVETSRNFTSKIALNSTGKILTVTLTSGSDVEIDDEDFSDATQTGGTVEDEEGNEMDADSDISDPSGSF